MFCIAVSKVHCGDDNRIYEMKLKKIQVHFEVQYLPSQKIIQGCTYTRETLCLILLTKRRYILI